jgi:hypothetical protein
VIYAESVFILSLLILLFALALHYYNVTYQKSKKLTKCSLGLLLTFLILVSWITIASVFADESSVVDVSYHPIIRNELSDGTFIDLAVIKDNDGVTHLVNLNESLGVSIPNDGGKYQVARVERSGVSFGLKFGDRRNYKIIPIK